MICHKRQVLELNKKSFEVSVFTTSSKHLLSIFFNGFSQVFMHRFEALYFMRSFRAGNIFIFDQFATLDNVYK